MQRLIIGIGHKSRVGKTECGEIIRKYLMDLHIQSAELNFSDGIKQAAASVFDLNQEQLYGDAKDTVDEYWGIEPRLMFRRMGDMMRELFGHDVWVRSWQRAVSNLDEQLVVVCCDVRLTSEAKKIKELGGFLIKVERPFTLKSDHPTEVDLDDWTDWDHTIWNHGSRKDLDYNACSILETILESRDLL